MRYTIYLRGGGSFSLTGDATFSDGSLLSLKVDPPSGDFSDPAYSVLPAEVAAIVREWMARESSVWAVPR